MCKICGDPNCKATNPGMEGMEEVLAKIFGMKDSTPHPQISKDEKKARQQAGKERIINRLSTGESFAAALRSEKSRSVTACAMAELSTALSGERLNTTEILSDVWDYIIKAAERREQIAVPATDSVVEKIESESESESTPTQVDSQQ